MSKKYDLKVTMFGGLKIICDDAVVLESGAKPNKPLELLAVLLLSDEESVSNDKIIESLWGEDNPVTNPTGTLKNTAYSLRKLLRVIDREDEFILTTPGGYAWNKDIEVSVDTREMEEIYKQINEKTLPEEKRVALCRDVMKMYLGDVLPGLEVSNWLIHLSHHYHVMYMDIVFELCNLLTRKGTRDAYEEIITVANKASYVEPVSERLYLLIFTSMKKLNMKEAILNFYQVVSGLFYDESGEQLCEEIREIYMWASHGNIHTELDLRHIRSDLEETTRSESTANGAYFCQYEMFKHMYHLVARGAERGGNCTALMLLTVTTKESMLPQKNDTVNSMLMLKDATYHALRKGDVFSRYSRNQLVLLLSVKEISDCDIVESRIRNLFGIKNKSEDVVLKISRLIMDPISADSNYRGEDEKD